MKIRHADHREKIELQMTAMIDVVFQLLIFFMVTFKIILPEGDFNIRMPLAAPENSTPEMDETPTLNLRLKCNDQGVLTSLMLGDLSFGAEADSFARLHMHIRSLVKDEGGPGTASEQEVEIDADYDLRYDYIIRSITALSGYFDENGQRHVLIKKIRLAKPKEE